MTCASCLPVKWKVEEVPTPTELSFKLFRHTAVWTSFNQRRYAVDGPTFTSRNSPAERIAFEEFAKMLHKELRQHPVVK